MSMRKVNKIIMVISHQILHAYAIEYNYVLVMLESL